MSYSQNKEEQFILEYFKGQTGHLLSIGENDGETLSNSRQLILNGWSGDLVEPSPKAFEKLSRLYEGNKLVTLHNVAISYFNGKTTLYESGEHLGKGDVGLLSSLDSEEVKRWKKESFNGVEIECKTYASLFGSKEFDFISIDAESLDVTILLQINLHKVSLVCVEHNSRLDDKKVIVEYCKGFGLTKEIYCNAENIILGR
jgi:FkbM family methyltransferase